jgi:hypothetical protein
VIAWMVAAVLLGLILFLLILPLDVELSVQMSGRPCFGLRLKYFFGMAEWVYAKGSRGGVRHLARRPAEQEPRHTALRFWRASQVEGVWESVWRLLRRLTGLVRLERIDVDLRVSLGDDYYTGMLTGAMMPVSVLLDSLVGGERSFRPVFEEDLMLDGYVKADLRMRPACIIVPCLVFVTSSPVQRARRILAEHR